MTAGIAIYASGPKRPRDVDFTHLPPIEAGCRMPAAHTILAGDSQRRFEAEEGSTAIAIVAQARRKEPKPRPYKCRSMPVDFVEQSAGKSDRQLCAHYRAGIMVVRRWVAQSGVPKHRTLRRPVPDDFAELAPTMSARRLADHYHCHYDTITRWLGETGIEPMRRPPPAPKPQRRPPVKKDGFAGPKSAFVSRLPRDCSIEGQAADFLRRETFVFRSTDTGSADQRGQYWRYGNVVLTGAELVARAKRHGFDPDGWRTISVDGLNAAIGDFARTGA